MGVEEQVGVLPQRGDHRWADSQVWDEMAIHHIDVEPIGDRSDHVDCLGEISEVSGEDRRRYAQVLHWGGRLHRERAFRRDRSRWWPPATPSRAATPSFAAAATPSSGAKR